MEANKGFKLQVTIVPGDRIRAYDFPVSDEFYIEGEVLSIDSDFIEILCDTDTKEGAPNKGENMLVPITAMLDPAWPGERIKKLNK